MAPTPRQEINDVDQSASDVVICYARSAVHEGLRGSEGPLAASSIYFLLSECNQIILTKLKLHVKRTNLIDLLLFADGGI